MDNSLKKIALHGVPRSGTTWLGEIFNSSPKTIYKYQPLFSYAHKGALNETSTKEDIDSFFTRIEQCNDDFTNQKDQRKNRTLPKFNKINPSHIIYKEVRYLNILPNLLKQSDDIKLCCLIRNPCSVINSWINAPREFRLDLDWKVMEEWRTAPKKNMGLKEEYFGYKKWKESTINFLELKENYNDRVYIQVYSDLLRNPVAATSKLFDFFELDFTKSTNDFITDSASKNNSNEYSVYRLLQSDNKYKSTLDDMIINSIESDLEGTNLEKYLAP